jgi:putative hydrolase of the HAD superfamily
MTSRDWWVDLIQKVLVAAQTKINDRSKLKEFSNFAFDEFTSEDCWFKYENCDVLLELLRAKNYKLGIISNFDERLPDILANLKLEKYFDFTLTPGTCNGYAKPCNEIFFKAVELGLNGEEHRGNYLHVGDSMELDYRPAVALGFKAMLLVHNISNMNDMKVLKTKDKDMYANNLRDLYEKIILNF